MIDDKEYSLPLPMPMDPPSSHEKCTLLERTIRTSYTGGYISLYSDVFHPASIIKLSSLTKPIFLL